MIASWQMSSPSKVFSQKIWIELFKPMSGELCSAPPSHLRRICANKNETRISSARAMWWPKGRPPMTVRALSLPALCLQVQPVGKQVLLTNTIFPRGAWIVVARALLLLSLAVLVFFTPLSRSFVSKTIALQPSDLPSPHHFPLPVLSVMPPMTWMQPEPSPA